MIIRLGRILPRLLRIGAFCEPTRVLIKSPGLQVPSSLTHGSQFASEAVFLCGLLRKEARPSIPTGAPSVRPSIPVAGRQTTVQAVHRNRHEKGKALIIDNCKTGKDTTISQLHRMQPPCYCRAWHYCQFAVELCLRTAISGCAWRVVVPSCTLLQALSELDCKPSFWLAVRTWVCMVVGQGLQTKESCPSFMLVLVYAEYSHAQQVLPLSRCIL